ncbi:hypothetical protein ACIBEJ_04670 [Nonomuraea sp. NPDC050790]|uniref:hypothetical protein n=1 Tax=Nonomuraea sp. NPDC050790 TaxID=3364371 RepID=UPI0037A86344
MTTILVYGALVWLTVLTLLLARMLRLMTGIEALAPDRPAPVREPEPERSAVLDSGTRKEVS